MTNIIELFCNAMYNQNLLQSKIFQESREKNINLPTGLLTADDGGLFLNTVQIKELNSIILLLAIPVVDLMKS